MKIALGTSCDFSVGSVNYMLEIGRNNQLGVPRSVYYNPLSEGKSFNEWGVVFENGNIVFSREQ